MKVNSKDKFIIAPSILSADFAKLGKEVSSVISAGANWVHCDIMDNHYVPNLTIGPMICKAIKPYCENALMDVHLMVTPVDELIHEFAKAGADIISFHPEASLHIDRSLSLIKSYGLKAGLVLNPATPLSVLDHVLDKLDVILIMTVNPGFGGQKFIPAMFDKIRLARKLIESSGKNIILQVDGGINLDNITDIAIAGANAFVMGNAIFTTPNYVEIIQAVRNKLKPNQ
jgi:ribulose-phosphate 3-epimerase